MQPCTPEVVCRFSAVITIRHSLCLTSQLLRHYLLSSQSSVMLPAHLLALPDQVCLQQHLLVPHAARVLPGGHIVQMRGPLAQPESAPQRGTGGWGDRGEPCAETIGSKTHEPGAGASRAKDGG